MLMLVQFPQQVAGKAVKPAPAKSALSLYAQVPGWGEHAPEDDITRDKSQVFKLRLPRIIPGAVQERQFINAFIEQPALHSRVFPFPLYLLLLRLLLFPNHYFW
jgi:hypothetical protein